MRRSGLHKLSCDCGAGVYMTLAQLRRGRPSCYCGGRMFPESLEVAMDVLPADELEAHPAMVEYRRQVASIGHGQASHIQRGRRVQSDHGLAFERLGRMQREEARARQLAGLVQFAAAAKLADEIPF